jgi:hypothetical protein
LRGNIVDMGKDFTWVYDENGAQRYLKRRANGGVRIAMEGPTNTEKRFVNSFLACQNWTTDSRQQTKSRGQPTADSR